MTVDATTSPPEVDLQDPLPESNWLWRRLFIFALTAIIVVACWWLLVPLRQAALQLNRDAILGAFDTIHYLFGVLVVLIIFYTVAPSGEQVAKMFNLTSILTKGAGWMASAAARAPDGRVATAQTVAGAGVVHPATVSPLEGASDGFGLPEQAGAYAGPPDDDAPPPPPGTPEEAPWR